MANSTKRALNPEAIKATMDANPACTRPSLGCPPSPSPASTSSCTRRGRATQTHEPFITRDQNPSMLEAQQHKAQETLTQQALQPPMTQTHEEAELRDHQERTSPSGHSTRGSRTPQACRTPPTHRTTVRLNPEEANSRWTRTPERHEDQHRVAI